MSAQIRTDSPSPLEQSALAYRNAGISVLPVQTDGSKSPTAHLLPQEANADGKLVGTWKPFQRRLATDEELARWYRTGSQGIGIIGGAISGGLTIIDVDDPATAEEFLIAFRELIPDLYARVPIITTPRPGKHLYIRVAKAQGNQKLAKVSPKSCLIETRGEGGYVIAPESPAQCHPTGRRYQADPRGIAIEDAPLLTTEEEELLFDLCRAYDKMPPRIIDSPKRPTQQELTDGERPGDAYNREAEWAEILEAAGWVAVFTTGAGVTHWRRPGKRSGTSGTTGACGEYFYCFSSNGEPFEAERAYSKFAALTLTQFAGDWNAAAKAIRQQARIVPVATEHAAKNPPPPKSLPAPVFEKTELGNAERLHALRGKDVRFIHERKAWLVWRGGRWQWDERNAVLRSAEQMGKQMVQEASRIKDDDERKAALKWAYDSQKRKTIDNAIYLLHGIKDVKVPLAEFDQHPDLFVCPNGTVDLETGTLHESKREHYLTACGTVLYDADARAPRWEQFIREAMLGDEDLAAYLQRLTGYAMTGRVRDHCLWICHGTGNNGKSTFLDTVYSIMGHDYAVQTPPDLLLQKRGETHPTELAVLRGKRLAITSELDGEAKLSNVRIKNLTGGDLLTARYVYTDFFTFKPTHKLIMATNHAPKITEHTVAMRRRLKVIPWNLKLAPHEVDRKLSAVLMDEAQGILNWMIEGARMWYADGLQHPRRVEDTSAEHFANTDIIAEWMDACTTIAGNGWCSHADLYGSYCQYTEARNEKPMWTATFGEKLSERPELARKVMHKQRGWSGITLIREPLRVTHPNND